jgi:hypothetical protein
MILRQQQKAPFGCKQKDLFVFCIVKPPFIRRFDDKPESPESFDRAKRHIVIDKQTISIRWH